MTVILTLGGTSFIFSRDMFIESGHRILCGIVLLFVLVIGDYGLRTLTA